MSLDAGTSVSSIFSVNFCNHSGRSRNRFPDAGMPVLSLRVVAELDELPSDVSCGNDVEDVLALSWKNLSIILDNNGHKVLGVA